MDHLQAGPLGGSILGQILADFPDLEVYIAPVLGVDFVEPWLIEREAE